MWWLFITGAMAEPNWNALKKVSDWQPYKQVTRKGIGQISVFITKISNLPCFKGEASTAGVSANTLLEIAVDPESAVDWSSANVVQAKTLAKNGSTIDYFQFLDVPIFSDRFWFLRGYIDQDDNGVWFHWDRLENGGPHKEFYNQIKESNKGAVEPPVNVGGWNFKQDGQTLQIRYFICTHPGGSVPKGMQSIGTGKTLPNNLEDIYKEGIRREQ